MMALIPPVRLATTYEVSELGLISPFFAHTLYRASHVLGDLGWVDLDLGSSPGWWAATVATYCPSRMVEHPKSKSTQPRYSTTRVTLYIVLHPVCLDIL